MAAMNESSFPPISDYALLSDCRNIALVSRAGSIDWCCMPRPDADSLFGRLLDWQRGGFCAITPVDRWRSTRHYEADSLMLNTRFETEHGCVEICDFFCLPEAGDNAPRELVRVVSGIYGMVELNVEVAPRFDYGETIPYVTTRPHAGAEVQQFRAVGSDQALLITSGHGLRCRERRGIEGKIKLHAGRHWFISMRFLAPEQCESAPALFNDLNAARRALEQNRHHWRRWLEAIDAPYRFDAQTVRSALVLKGLTYADTGAMVGAATTSLPEQIGGGRNWDYRFCWIRDSVYAVGALHRLGLVEEADALRHFITRSTAGSADQTQILYAVSGKRRLTEIELEFLSGYRNSKPVRIGNGAAEQHQWDVFGELLQLASLAYELKQETDPNYWPFLEDVLNHVCDYWTEPDRGIWEIRGEPRHFVHSKVCCWSALNTGIALAERFHKKAPLGRWKKHRAAIRDAVQGHGFDARRGVYRQAFDSPCVDAVLLRLPRLDYIPYRDDSMIRTVGAIRAELDEHGLLKRYNAPDGLDGGEGVFVPCTFWLVTCLARQGRLSEARQYYQRALACANDLGLFSEEYDTAEKIMLGNFPQALTHVSQISAYMALHDASP